VLYITGTWLSKVTFANVDHKTFGVRFILVSEGHPSKLGRTVYPSEVPGAKSFQADANAVYVADGKPCHACAGKHRAHTCGKGNKELTENKETVDLLKPLMWNLCRYTMHPQIRLILHLNLLCLLHYSDCIVVSQGS